MGSGVNSIFFRDSEVRERHVFTLLSILLYFGRLIGCFVLVKEIFRLSGWMEERVFYEDDLFLVWKRSRCGKEATNCYRITLYQKKPD